MHVCYQPTGSQYCVNSGVNLPYNAWTTVVVTVNAVVGLMTVQLIGAANRQHSTSLAPPAKNLWSSTVIFAADPWYRSANAQMRNVMIGPPRNDMTVRPLPMAYYIQQQALVRPGQVVGRVTLPSSYIVQLEVTHATCIPPQKRKK